MCVFEKVCCKSFKVKLILNYVLQEMNMMYVPFVWMNMRMETSSESFRVLMVSSRILGLVFVLRQLSKTPCLNPTVNMFID